MNMPVEEAARIQEVLKPLNYEVTGFRNGDCNNYYGDILYLRRHDPVFRKDPDVPGANTGEPEPALSMDGVSEAFSVRELNSEATAIKLMGLALEKVEKEMLREMGIQIGGICPTIEIVEQHSDWLEGVRVSMVFDIQKLNGYFNGAVQPQKKEKEL